jgi:hypothetical protein
VISSYYFLIVIAHFLIVIADVLLVIALFLRVIAHFPFSNYLLLLVGLVLIEVH